MPFTWAWMLSFINISIIIVLNWGQKQSLKVGIIFFYLQAEFFKNFFANYEINPKKNLARSLRQVVAFCVYMPLIIMLF